LGSVYLRRAGDESRKAMLYNNRLVFVDGEKRREFDFNKVTRLNLNRRKLLLPLIFGGILVPLLLVGLFATGIRPQVILLMLFPSALLFYLGWEGQEVLTVTGSGREADVRIHRSNHHIQAFVEFVNNLIRSRDPSRAHERLYYIRRSDLNRAADPAPGIWASTYAQVRQAAAGSEDRLGVDPLKLTSRVEYRFDPESHQLRPYILDGINPEAIGNL
jgi:hypothetical protein